MNTLELVTNEIVDLHEFFVGWLNGTVDRDQLEPRFLSRLDVTVVFIPHEGRVMTGEMLKDGFERGYGSNENFRIQIRDVSIRQEIDDLVLATYKEWQVGATQSAPNNARVTSVLLKMTTPITWLHIQETWLPDAEREAGSFDF